MTRGAYTLAGFAAVSLLVVLIAPLVGPQLIPLRAVFSPGAEDPEAVIFWQLRLPRVCLAWLAGAGLAVAGMAFQALFRNALATPFTLGVSSGSAFGAALGLRLGLGGVLFGLPGAGAGALIGGLAAIALVYGLTQLKRDSTTATLLLAGVAVNFFFSSLILLVQYTADFYDTMTLLRWLMGGLQSVGFEAPLQLLPFVVAGTILLAWRIAELDLLTTGEALAASRGVAVGRVKATLFLGVSVVVAVIVSQCGPIGFIGLMCPHICRLMVGAGHRQLLPASLLFGGGFLVVCDTVARTAFAPAELPVGIFTSLLGAPFFLWLLLRPSRDGGLSV